jgi:hypothetical protein
MIAYLTKKLRNYLTKKVILQDWVCDLDLVVQSSLISVIRGTDMNNGMCDESKNITKMLRYIIVNDAKKKNSYMSDYVINQSKVIGFLVKSYPDNKHWVDHVVGVAFHIKRNHPDKYVCEYWGNVAHIYNNRIKNWKAKEKKRIEKEQYIKRVYEKYLDIYTNRYV